MSLITILSEIWRFIRENLIKIMIGSIIISGLAILASYLLTDMKLKTFINNEVNEEQMQNVSSNDLDESQKYLTDIYQQIPASFEMFVQLEDGNLFGNSFIFDEYFTSEDVVEAIESQTAVEISETLLHEENLQLHKTSEYRGSIAGIRNTSSNVITIRVQVGKNSRENLIVAEELARMIESREIPFTEGLIVTMISEPEIGEKLVGSDLSMVSSPAALGLFKPNEPGRRSSVLVGIAGFILGIIISSGVLFIIQLFRSKINYAFQYSWDFDDYHVLLKNKNDKFHESVKKWLLFPMSQKQIVICSESPLIDNLKNELINIEFLPDLKLFSKNEDIQITIFIESNVTDKQWYKEQYQLAELSASPIKIIHLIK